jgi:hypothetical protein
MLIEVKSLLYRRAVGVRKAVDSKAVTNPTLM